MEGRPPIAPGSANSRTQPDLKISTGPVSKTYETPEIPSGRMMIGRQTPTNPRMSSRGSQFGGLEEGNDHMYINVDRNQPMPINRMNTTGDKNPPLISDRAENGRTSYRAIDPNNPLDYGPDDNLRKLRNNVYAKHNYGEDAMDPFQEMNLQDMNDEDEKERQRIKHLEDEMQRNKQEIEKAKMKLEKKQLYDLYEKETSLVNRLEEIKRNKEEEQQLNEKIRKKVIEIKLKQKNDEEEKKKIDRMMWNMERDTKMEELVRK